MCSGCNDLIEKEQKTNNIYVGTRIQCSRVSRQDRDEGVFKLCESDRMDAHCAQDTTSSTAAK